jgi:hypothetical protein
VRPASVLCMSNMQMDAIQGHHRSTCCSQMRRSSSQDCTTACRHQVHASMAATRSSLQTVSEQNRRGRSRPRITQQQQAVTASATSRHQEGSYRLAAARAARQCRPRAIDNPQKNMSGSCRPQQLVPDTDRGQVNRLAHLPPSRIPLPSTRTMSLHAISQTATPLSMLSALGCPPADFDAETRLHSDRSQSCASSSFDRDFAPLAADPEVTAMISAQMAQQAKHRPILKQHSPPWPDECHALNSQFPNFNQPAANVVSSVAPSSKARGHSYHDSTGSLKKAYQQTNQQLPMHCGQHMARALPKHGSSAFKVRTIEYCACSTVLLCCVPS